MTKPKKNQEQKNQRKSEAVRTTKTDEIDYDEFDKKPLKIDDTPLNVARSFFGIRSDKFGKPDSS